MEFKRINIINSIIIGNISFSGSHFSEDVIFINTTFYKNVEFDKTLFDAEVDFTNSSFDAIANFSESRFMDIATFDLASFNGTSDFGAANFEKSASFYNATFVGDAIFFLSQFNGAYANFEFTQFLEYVDFCGSQFTAYLSFMDAKVLKTADFGAIRFFNGANFKNSTFSQSAKFDLCHFSEDSIFRRMVFNETVDFSNTKFDGPSFFNSTRFYGNAIFNGVQFMGPSDFTDVQFDKDFAMNNTKISTMVLDRANFSETSRLFLAKSDITRLLVEWTQIKGVISYDSSAYLALIKNYRDMGMNDAEDCYYQFRSTTQQSRRWGWAKILDILADITCGYGVRPARPILCSIFLVVVCSVILWLGNGLRIPAHKEKRTELLDSFYYCLAIFFTIPLPDHKPAGKYRYVPVVLRALGWTLFAILIATLGRIIIK